MRRVRIPETELMEGYKDAHHMISYAKVYGLDNVKNYHRGRMEVYQTFLDWIAEADGTRKDYERFASADEWIMKLDLRMASKLQSIRHDEHNEEAEMFYRGYVHAVESLMNKFSEEKEGDGSEWQK